MQNKMKTQQTQKITKDMLIAEILAENPEKAQILAETLMDFGIHCVGCGAAAFETLEQGVLGHGFSEEDLNNLIKQLNKILNIKEDLEKESFKNFSLKLTSSAIKKVKEIIKQEKEGEQKTGNFLTNSSSGKSRIKEKTILRISILPGGCSGHVYNLEIIDNPIKSDLNFKQDGLNIAVDKNSLEFLNRTEIDFVDTLKESGFKFNNPNANKECGCGKSFK